MELELLGWLVRRWLANPWVWAGWLALVGLGSSLGHVAHVGIRSEVVSSQGLTAELAYGWGLLGALLALSALGELDGRIDPLPATRRWRARGFVLCAAILGPALPIVAIGAYLTRSGGEAAQIGSAVGVLTLLVAVAIAVERLPAGTLRSFTFLALAWWLPALVRVDGFGPMALLEQLEIQPIEAGTRAESALWSVWVGSMLTFILLAIALDLFRQPQHEVRHPR